MDNRTKIVATLGPASEAPEVLEALIVAGVDVVRLNLSHGDLEGHLARLAAVRSASERLGRVVAVLADLPGPKVRAAQFPEGGVSLREGDRLRLIGRPADDLGSATSTGDLITVGYPALLDDLHEGDRVVVGDGAITLEAIGRDGESMAMRVRTGGRVQGRPGIHLPSSRLRLSSPTDDDIVMARRMADAGVDFLAVSFVRSAADLARVREAIAPHRTRLVAKIETMHAVADLEAIVGGSDAVMVARGDLGIEYPLEEVPHLQKRIIRYCVEAGVPVITATQMMESMISAPSPTRAEVSDVANAVFDGTDALMLSAETAVGADPAEVVRAMARVAGRAEQEAGYAQWGARLGRTQRASSTGPDRIAMAITHAAAMAAGEADAAAILCCSRSGRTVRAMARFRPLASLVGLSPDPATVRSLALSWGVVPMSVEEYASTDELVWFAVERSVQAGLVASGDTVLVLAGAPDRGSGSSTDVLRVVRVA
ncbi:MAG: pyruvate kinase [Ilumatobacteraceae bacterium]